MKKIFLIIIIVCFCFSFSSVAFAEGNTVLESEIDYDEFLCDAEVVDYNEYSVTLQSTEIVPNSFSTFSGETSKASKLVTFIMDDEEETQAFLLYLNNRDSAMRDGSNYKDKWDSSGAVKIYTTVYYSEKVISSVPCVKLTKVTGGITAGGSGSVVGGGVSIVGNSCVVGHRGNLPNGGDQESFNKTNTYANSVRAWTYTLPTVEYIIDNYFSDSGATYQVTLKRGTQTWYVEMENNII